MGECKHFEISLCVLTSYLKLEEELRFKYIDTTIRNSEIISRTYDSEKLCLKKIWYIKEGREICKICLWFLHNITSV